MKSVDECISFCLGQTVLESDEKEIGFNWMPREDFQCKCLMKVFKFIKIFNVSYVLEFIGYEFYIYLNILNIIAAF